MNRRTFFSSMAGGFAVAGWAACRRPNGTPVSDYPVRPVPFTSVQIADPFWSPRLETNRRTTLPVCFRRCEETGRFLHFDLASGAATGEFVGRRYDDSDVYKVIEGASYALHLQHDAELDAYLDDLIARIAAAQEPDGYLFTTRTANPDAPVDTPPGRWSDLAHGHELYNLGHLFEAAVAHHRATGKRSLLDVALRAADLVDSEFGEGKRYGVPGHEEIEIGLVKLFHLTGEARYLDLARFFIDQRGRPEHRELLGVYAQDHLPVIEQSEAVGHAVRAGYLYSGIADVAALSNRPDYVSAIDRIWDDVVSSKLYLTGGIGASRRGEDFAAPFELPNAEAYAETCAAIANMLWNHRLFLLHGDSRTMDVMERTLYNGFLSGVSLGGDLFFYPNPLESDGASPFNHGSAVRQPWFGTACCPTNVVRFMPSIAGYIHAVQDRSLYVNLFIGGTATMAVAGHPVTVETRTRYPWEGQVDFVLRPEKPAAFALRLRIPGWAQGRPVPGSLYTYLDAAAAPFSIEVNGEPVAVELEKGYAVVTRTWTAGDHVRLHLPMPVRRVLGDERITSTLNRVALERGPIVYCLEGVDHDGKVLDLEVPDAVLLETEHRPDLLGGVTVLRGSALRNGKEIPLTAVPYYAWAHRGAGEMAVWMKRGKGGSVLQGGE